MMSRRGLTRLGWLGIVLIVPVSPGFAQSVGRQADAAKAFRDSVAARRVAIAAGRKLFYGQGTCAACHGAKLEGTAIAPTLRSPKWRNGDGSLAMILRVLRDGVPNTSMVRRPGNLNDTQLSEVASYVWAVSRRAVPP